MRNTTQQTTKPTQAQLHQMLASTIQFTNTTPTPPHHTPPIHHTDERFNATTARPPRPHTHACCLRTQQCADTPPPATPTPLSTPHNRAVLTRPQPPTATQPVVPLLMSNHPYTQTVQPGSPHPTNHNHHTRWPHSTRHQMLLRKEVIQPHLPVRLPCYDFVPIASPTFDHSPPYGLGHGLRVLPTFVT